MGHDCECKGKCTHACKIFGEKIIKNDCGKIKQIQVKQLLVQAIQYGAQFPATFCKWSFLIKKRISMRNESFQTFIDISSFIILSDGFQVVVEDGTFKFM